MKHLMKGAAIALIAMSEPLAAKEVTVSVWSRADRAGPMRAGNIEHAASTLNAMLQAAGSETTVRVELIETNAKGFDADALDLLKAHSIGQGPDIAVAAHEWTGTLVEAGFAANLEDHIASVPDLYADMIPSLWKSVSYKNARYGVPQDSEIRMFFYNNDMLRKLGKDEIYIGGLSAAVNAGEFTLYDACDLAAEAVEKGVAKHGLLHRPNVGPDFQMLLASFDIDIYDADSAKLQMSASKLEKFYDWIGYCVNNGAIPADMTSWDWSSVHNAFRGDKNALIKFHGIWHGNNQLDAFGRGPCVAAGSEHPARGRHQPHPHHQWSGRNARFRRARLAAGRRGANVGICAVHAEPRQDRPVQCHPVSGHSGCGNR